MVPSLQDLGIDQLSIEERITLAQEILDSVVAERPVGSLSQAKQQELRRRLADHAANPDDLIPWEQVEAPSPQEVRFGLPQRTRSLNQVLQVIGRM